MPAQDHPAEHFEAEYPDAWSDESAHFSHARYARALAFAQAEWRLREGAGASYMFRSAAARRCRAAHGNRETFQASPVINYIGLPNPAVY